MRRSPLARLTVPHASTMRLSAPRRGIVVGRDRSHFNSGILMVPQDEEWMIERMGQYNRTAIPGLNFAIPLFESIAYKRSLKETTIPIHPQTAITKDNVHVQLDGAVYTRVEDAYKASYGIDSPESAMYRRCDSNLRLSASLRLTSVPVPAVHGRTPPCTWCRWRGRRGRALAAAITTATPTTFAACGARRST